MVIENTKDFQKWGNNVNTCGRFVVIRVYLFLQGLSFSFFIATAMFLFFYLPLVIVFTDTVKK